MEKSFIYDMLEINLLYDYQTELRNKDEGNYLKEADEAENNLLNVLDEEDKSKLKEFKYRTNMFYEFLYYNISVKVLNYGIEMGMQLQNALDERNNK